MKAFLHFAPSSQEHSTGSCLYWKSIRLNCALPVRVCSGKQQQAFSCTLVSLFLIVSAPLSVNAFNNRRCQGAVFVDPTAERPVSLSSCQIMVSRRPTRICQLTSVRDTRVSTGRSQAGCWMVKSRNVLSSNCSCCMEAMTCRLFARPFVATMMASCESPRALRLHRSRKHAGRHHRTELCQSLPERQDFIERGFAYQAAEFADPRRRWTEKARTGDPRERRTDRIKTRQKSLKTRKAESLAVIDVSRN